MNSLNLLNKKNNAKWITIYQNNSDRETFYTPVILQIYQNRKTAKAFRAKEMVHKQSTRNE